MGNRLAELLVPNMDEKVDPTMMAALMSACSLINAGAGTEEVRSCSVLSQILKTNSLQLQSSSQLSRQRIFVGAIH